MSKFVMPDGREYPIMIAEITNTEARLLQEVTGLTYYHLAADLDRVGPDGKTAFLWLAMRKADHHVDYNELEFPMGKVIFEHDEVDPTKGSPGTRKPAKSTSRASTRSTSGRRTPHK